MNDPAPPLYFEETEMHKYRAFLSSRSSTSRHGWRKVISRLAVQRSTRCMRCLLVWHPKMYQLARCNSRQNTTKEARDCTFQTKASCQKAQQNLTNTTAQHRSCQLCPILARSLPPPTSFSLFLSAYLTSRTAPPLPIYHFHHSSRFQCYLLELSSCLFHQLTPAQ